MIIKQYYFNLTNWQLIFLTLLITIPFATFAQQQIFTSEETTISGGAEYNRELQKAIRDGRGDNYKSLIQLIPKANFSPEAITPFDGSNFDDNSTYNGGFLFIPPDPSGVAGTDRVISVINTLIECRNKTGTLLWRDDLAGFFASLLVPAGNYTFDPKVIYDQYEGRFVVVDLELVESGINPSAGNTSRILLAVSKTSSPGSATSSDWYYKSINSKEVIGGSDHWADYPGFAIDEEAVYVTANMFAHTGGTTTSSVRLWIIDKGLVGGFYSGGSLVATKYNPYAGGGVVITTQPTHIFGTSGAGTGIGTYLVSYSGLNDGLDEYVQIVRVNNPLSSPTFTGSFINIGNIEGPTFPALPDAPQSGISTLVEVNDRRALHSVWRNNELWLTTTILPNSGTDANQTTAHWFKMSTTSGGVVTYADQGNAGGEDIAPTTSTFFPSIAVNSTGDVIIGFSASAATIYAGAYYSGRFSSDPAGTLQPSVVVRAGVDYYVRTFGGPRNRWGDYTGASIDPADGSFWVFNQYAMIRGTLISGEEGRWATVYANVPLSELPVELSSFTAKVLKSGGIKLDWRTETEVNNYGFELERLQDYNIEKLQDWEKIGFVEGNGNSNSPKEYSYTDEGIDYGSYTYRLKQIDTDGDFEYSNVIEVEAGNIPDGFVLEQNYPNPFNPSTTIKFALAETQSAKLIIYDVLGNEVAVPFNGTAEGGKVYEAEFNATSLSSGIYFYRLATENKVENRKMLLLK